ncbi:MAG: PIN domain-containing protein [Thermoplasmata archaeon]
MTFVVDTNILISSLLADSVTRKLIFEVDEKLFSPDFLEIELEKHKDIIREKSGLSTIELDSLLTLLMENIIVVPKEIYDKNMSKADDILGGVDKKDVPFIAVALEKGAAIWSDDKDFEKQDVVDVWKTSRMIAEFL